MLNEEGGKYGDNIIDEYSKKLVVEVGKKYNRRTLFRMKQFYKIFNDEKVSQLATQLSWSHWYEMLWNDFTGYLVMKKCPQCGHNWHIVI